MVRLFSASLATLIVASVAVDITKIPSFPNLQSGDKREIFHYEHTVVIRDSGTTDNKVRRCVLLNVHELERKVEVFSQLKKLLNVDVKEILMYDIMNMTKECNSVDESSDQETTDPDSSENENSNLHFIVPGTKWCGAGNIARSYHDLGKNRNVDSCCRSHDHCPIYVTAKNNMYNITNDAMYTASHCMCDEALYECLKKDNGLIARMTGKLYFDLLRIKCIFGLPENINEEMKIVPTTRNW